MPRHTRAAALVVTTHRRRTSVQGRYRTSALAGSFALGVALCSAAAAVFAGPEEIAFPKEYATWEKYAIVDRYDNKQYRELYAKPEIVKAVREGKPIPRGAVVAMAIHAAEADAQGVPVKDANGRFKKGKLTAVTVMEKRDGFGAKLAPELRNGEWEYASFLPDGNRNPQQADTTACFQCHKPHEGQDYVISLASLAGKFPTAAVAAKTGATDVNIANFAFGPTPIKVKKGQTINWTNTDDSPHQISIKDPAAKTGVLLKGQTGSLAVEKAGTLEYGCALHPAMKGTIEVTE
jgi:plastocyanin